MDKYESLRPYCNTDAQRHLLDVLSIHSTVRETARALNIAERNVFHRLRTIKKQAAKRGFSLEHDMSKTVPEGYSVKGVSTLYDDNGEVKVQWVKSQETIESQAEVQQELLEAFIEKLPKEKAAPTSKIKHKPDLLNLYIVTDFHLGMKADEDVTRGENWDMKIAEELIMDWFKSVIRDAPATETAIFAQLGDFLHWDGIDAVTQSGHLLDVDTRYQRLIRIAIKVLRRITRLLLKKHEHVYIIHAEGNHDITGSMWLREVFAAWYDDEPRITVDTSADPYYGHRFHNTLLVFHHGHKRKMQSLDSVLVAKFREDWGQATHCYAHTGHLHHDRKLETNLMTVEQHRTLAAPDAYAARGGYLSGRSASVITYHSEHGEVGRIVRSPEMV